MSTKPAKAAISKVIALVFLALVMAVSTPVQAQVCGPDPDGRVANAVYRDTTIVWEPLVEYDRMILTIGGPCEDIVREFRRGEPIVFDIRDIKRIQDGAYRWELRRAAVIDPATQKALAKSRALGDDSIWWGLWQSGAIPQGPYVDSASFLVANGVIVPPDLVEEGKSGLAAKTAGAGAARPQAVSSPVPAAFAKGSGPTPIAAADQVIPDDLIVQGSLCVGFDCVNGESFSFDTIRLKENNLRIKFDDTSTLAGFPSNDWQLTANDSASGGASKFSIEDVTGAKVPFTIRAGAPSNSLFVANSGRVGFRTSTPVLDLHVNTSNTPGLRLEQNSSGGFSAQTWDIAGNETNFFIRDVTGGSRLPFRIRPGAPTSSIDIGAAGDVGIGTASPTRRLTVVTTGAADNTVLEIQNNGATRMRINNTSNGEIWNLGHQSPAGTGFVISDVGDAVSEMLMDTAGNVTFAGTVTPSSSRTVKEQFSPVDSRAVLQRVLDLPITSWSYKATPGVRHVGPMSEDFFAAFQVGADDKGISVTDSAGVALAAIQGLHQELQEKDRKIAELEAEISQIKELLKNLTRQQ